MFVPKIGNLDKTRFGINFNINDFKCNIDKKDNQKEDTKVNKVK